jgi:toxin ParE1/3/4
VKVTYSYSAQDDLLEIHKWIHRDSPKRANSFIDEIEQVCETLGEAPLAYPIFFEDGNNCVRRRVWQSYLIFYRVESDVLVILRAGHAAQNWTEDNFD